MSPNNTIAICCNNKIEYFYDAVGTKQKKKVTNGAVITTTDYAGNYIYRNNALQFISQPEGYLELDGQGGYDYTYQYKDHLGNIRLSYKDISTTSIPVLQILEENNYYPFGLKHKGYNDDYSSNRNAVASKFKYNGKELNDELGMDLYDYGARMYDPALGRWNVPDPLSQFHSPYNYAGNNPISMIDPSGMYAMGVTYKNGTDGFNEIIEEFGIGTNNTSSSEDNEEETPEDPPKKNTQKKRINGELSLGVESPEFMLAKETPDDWSILTDSEKILAFINLIRKWRMQGAEVVDLRGLFLNFSKMGIGTGYIKGKYNFWSNSVFLQLNMLAWKDMKVKTQFTPYKELTGKKINGYEGDWWRLDFNAYRGEGIINTHTLVVIYVDNKDYELLKDYLKQ